MKVQRGQHGLVNDPYDFNRADGQHGLGIYTFPFGDTAMQEYYTSNGENLYTFEIPDELVLDMSKSKIDYWEAKKTIYNNNVHKAFMFEHSGSGIPTSKEIVITDPTIIENITKK